MSKPSRFANTRVMIVDDHSEMRASLKSMLDMFGATKIDQALNGEEAIEMLKSRSYDLVCCDYELGRGKDGQQVLEEARFAKLLKAGASFVMITAAQTLEMVMGALEYQPDGYIAKPVTYEELHKRLSATLRRKAIFADINNAIDDGETNEAIEECNKLIVEKPKYALLTYRIKGNLLFEDGRLDEAKELYSTVISIRPVGWAKLGFAKCLYAMDNSAEAKPILEELIESNPKQVESYDLLAKILEQEGDFKATQEILEKATEISPKAVLRQTHLSKVATKNEDWEVAAKSSRKAVALGKDSVHKNPNNYLNLAKSLQNQLSGGGYREKTYANNEINRALDNVRKDYTDDQQVHVKASLLEGLTLKNLGKAEEAKQTVEVARAIFNTLKITQAKPIVPDVGKTYVDVGDKKGAHNFLTEMKEKNMLNDESEELLEHVTKEVLEIQKHEEEEKLRREMDNKNNKAVSLFEKGDLDKAIVLFKEALQNPHASLSLYLNTIQAIIVNMQKNGYDKMEGDFVRSLFKKVEKFERNEKAIAKTNKLFKMYSNIKK